MVATRAQKRSAAENSNPLCQTGILQRVLGYVGPGHWFYLSTVCSLWGYLYSRVADTTLQKRSYLGNVQQFSCVPQMTLYSSMFASPSRVRLAHQQEDVNNSTSAYQYAAGKYSTVASLVAAHELGMDYTAGKREALLNAISCL
jgi:hypothetical protein